MFALLWSGQNTPRQDWRYDLWSRTRGISSAPRRWANIQIDRLRASQKFGGPPTSCFLGGESNLIDEWIEQKSVAPETTASKAQIGIEKLWFQMNWTIFDSVGAPWCLRHLRKSFVTAPLCRKNGAGIAAERVRFPPPFKSEELANPDLWRKRVDGNHKDFHLSWWHQVKMYMPSSLPSACASSTHPKRIQSCWVEQLIRK